MSIASEVSQSALPTTADNVRVSPALIGDIDAVLLPLSVFAAGVFAKFIYFDFVLAAPVTTSSYFAIGALAALFAALLNRAFGVNVPRSVISTTVQATKISASVTLTFLLLVSLFYLLKISDAFSRGWLLCWYALSIVAMLATRLGVIAWVDRLRTRNLLVKRVAVYGQFELARQVIYKLDAGSSDQTDIFTYCDDGPSDKRQTSGGMRQLIEAAQREPFDLVIVTLPVTADEELRDAASNLEMLPVDVKLSPGAISLPTRDFLAHDNYDGLLLLDIQKRPFRGRSALVKPLMDSVIATVAIILTAPIMVFIALAIKLDSRGPVLFLQRRHGYNHRVVSVTKFRTMAVAQDGADVVQAVRGDRRITRVGRFLRKTSLDELPQLFDVLRGDMSLVGPRPHALSHNDHYARIIERYPLRHKVKPGITGWAQINGWRGETRDPESMRRRLECDLYYIDNWSVWLDLHILARTLLVPFHDPNAY